MKSTGIFREDKLQQSLTDRHAFLVFQWQTLSKTSCHPFAPSMRWLASPYLPSFGNLPRRQSANSDCFVSTLVSEGPMELLERKDNDAKHAQRDRENREASRECRVFCGPVNDWQIDESTRHRRQYDASPGRICP
jgi:hypothetical protein